MQKHPARLFALLFVVLTLTAINLVRPGGDTVLAQIPTGSVPTVTGTPKGPVASVRPDINEEFVNVRTGPNVLYPSIGLLLVGQEVPVIGKSSGGTWLLIEYPGVPSGQGWVYAPNMNLSPGANPPVVEPPPTPTPEVTPTIDPTMAAQFINTAAPTRLPTFTPPPPLVIPTFEAETGFITPGNLPMGMVIVILFTLGVVIGIFSLFQGR